MDLGHEEDDVVVFDESTDDESEAAAEEEEEEERRDNGERWNPRDLVIYNRLVGRLHRDDDVVFEDDDDDWQKLWIEDSEHARVMLENIDSFCQVLRSVTWLSSVQLGNVYNNSQVKVEINESNSDSWNKLFSALGGIQSIGDVQVHGTNFSTEIVVQTIQAASPEEDITMWLSWRSNADDLKLLIEAVSSLRSDDIHLYLLDPDGAEGDTKERFQEGNIFQIICDYRWQMLRLVWIDFTYDESKEFGRVLSTNRISAGYLDIQECTFDNKGGELVARGLRENTSMESITLRGVLMQDEVFRNELVQSFPLNTSAESLSCHDNDIPVSTALELTKSIAQQNRTLKSLFFNNTFLLSSIQKQELKEAVSRSFNLEYVYFHCGGQKQPESIQAILELNKAGRRYLAEDATSRSKCIAVLTKVKNNLDCLFYHIRENPVLCLGYTRSNDETTAGKKRKQSDR